MRTPLTFQAIIIWREELEAGKVLLRDIIDLEATYAGPDGKASAKPIGEDGELAPATAPRTPPAGLSESAARPKRLSKKKTTWRTPSSLSAMEAGAAEAQSVGNLRPRRGRL